MLYRYGMYFVPAEKKNPPEVYELFPLWSEEECKEMELATIAHKLRAMAAKPVRKEHHE